MGLRKKIQLLFVLLVGCIPFHVSASDRLESVSLSYVHHKLGVPFMSNPVGDLLRPGFSLAGEYAMSTSRGVEWNLKITGTVSRQPAASPYGTAFSVGIAFAPRVNLPAGFSIDGHAGLLYRHVFSNQTTYRIAEDNVVPERDWGRSHIGINLGFGPGYDLRAVGVPMRIFARADMELLYAPSSGFGMLNVLPATTLLAGISYLPGGVE